MTETTTPKAKADPIVISAPKGGTQVVSPKKGAVAKAIAKTGLSVQAIARQHHQNPSQLRRLSLDQVAKVDLVRAESIAAALGVEVGQLFGEAETKAKATTPKPATSTAKAPAKASKAPRRSRATKAAEKTAQDAPAAG